jgi:CheY-like chemotaxis protein
MDDLLSFIPEVVQTPGKPTEFWNILIVDDEQSVHDVTHFALKGFVFEDKALQFHSAFSAREALELLKTQADLFQVLLLDIVMEHRSAGIEVVNFLRNELKNNTLQIVVRTGNPGLAPEDYLVHHYEINDYEEKNGLTVQRLKTSLTAALRAYRNIETIQHIVANKIAELQDLRQTLRQVTFATNHTYPPVQTWAAPVSLPVFLRNTPIKLKHPRVDAPISVQTSDIGMTLQFMQEKIAATTQGKRIKISLFFRDIDLT